jgi:hypothetical protein
MFSKLKGTRVLLNKPEAKTQVIELSVADKAALEEEQMLTAWTQLEVFATGDKVTDTDIVEGAKVYISTQALETAEKIEIDGDVKLLVNELSIIIIW